MSASLLSALNAGYEDATSVAESVRNGSRLAVDVVAAAREMAESDDGRAINAFITEDWDRAAASAASLDRRRAAGEALGPLAGVPVSVKDVIAVAGLPVTAASLAFADTVAVTTAPAVQRLLDADAILIGKTNCPEFAFGVTCDSPLAGRTRNPRYPAATPGGSSGGEAALLAAGISALGVGTDFGGSVRWPAQCVGIAALRPGIGAVPGDGQVPGANGNFGSDGTIPAASDGMQGAFQTIGPMARSVRDLRTAFLIMSGSRQTAMVPPSENPLTISWSDGALLGPVRAEVSAMMKRLAERLGREGHRMMNAPQVFADCLPAYNRLRAVDPMVDHGLAVKGREHSVSVSNLQTISSTFAYSPEEVRGAWADAENAREAVLRRIAEVDIALLPVAGGPAGDVNGCLDIDGRIAEGWELMSHCRAVTLTGCPSVSLPVARSEDGLPLSIQVIAGPGEDLKALDFAESLEELLSIPDMSVYRIHN